MVGTHENPVKLHRDVLFRITLEVTTAEGVVNRYGKPVDKVVLRFAAIDPGFSAGTTITLNGIVLPGDYFTNSEEWKEIILVEGNAITFGGDTLDAEGYPTTLLPAPTLSRLP